jgi:hypothetical protein
VIQFQLGTILATKGAKALLDGQAIDASKFIERHARGDWGDISPIDKKANNRALIDGSRIISAYFVRPDRKIFIITEAEDDDGHRVATTILLVEEY